MLFVILGIALAGLALLAGDRLREAQKISPEVARKIPHIVSGCVFSYWPWFIGWNWMISLAILYLMAAIITRRLNMFSRIRYVDRVSWGEYLFPIGVILLALIQPSKVVFMVALLHFGIADAVAALVGRKYGEKFITYKVFGQLKTVIGSLVFLAISVVLVGAVVLTHPEYENTALALLVIVPIVATFLENCGAYGTDNILVPVGVALLLYAPTQLVLG